MMKRKRWIAVPAMAAVMAAMLALVVGAGYAFAQEDGSQPGQQAPGRAGRGPLGRHILGGEVVKVENNTITVKTVRTGEEKAVNVDGQTKYRKDGKDASLADVTPGETIGVIVGKKPEEGQNTTAKAIIIGKPQDRPKPVVGNVSAVSGDTVTVTTSEGDKQVKIPAITQGMRIAVITAPDGTVRGVMYNPPERPEGAPEGAPGDVPPGPPADSGAEGGIQDNA